MASTGKEADLSVKIMLHLAWGGQNAESKSFLDKALAQGGEFDIIGQSYYSKWHGPLDDLRANLTDLAARYKQDIIVVEYLTYFQSLSDTQSDRGRYSQVVIDNGFRA